MALKLGVVVQLLALSIAIGVLIRLLGTLMEVSEWQVLLGCFLMSTVVWWCLT